MEKHTKEGKDGQDGRVSSSIEADYSPDKYAGLGVVVTETEYLEQKGPLSPLSLEPVSPLLFSHCLFLKLQSEVEILSRYYSPCFSTIAM